MAASIHHSRKSSRATAICKLLNEYPEGMTLGDLMAAMDLPADRTLQRRFSTTLSSLRQRGVIFHTPVPGSVAGIWRPSAPATGQEPQTSQWERQIVIRPARAGDCPSRAVSSVFDLGRLALLEQGRA